MEWVLWLNTIGETLIALGMFSVPPAFFPGAAGVAWPIARAFSFAILSVAYISFSVTGRDVSPDARRTVVGILVVYHVTQLLAQFVNAGLHPPLLVPPVVIHTVFSVLFVTYWVRLRRPA